MFDRKTVLVIAPHPDDEIFGVGGTIYRLKENDCKVYVLYMTVGDTVDFSSAGKSLASDRFESITKVTEYLGIDGYSIALPGNEYHLKLDALPQSRLIHEIERGNDISLHNIRPDIVFTSSNADYNQDHRAVFEATISALRPASTRVKSYQPIVLTYELPYHQWQIADSEVNPQLYVRLGERELDAKVTALEFYASQLKDPDNPLSVKGVRTLAYYRGLHCDAHAAEAFQVRRLVI